MAPSAQKKPEPEDPGCPVGCVPGQNLKKLVWGWAPSPVHRITHRALTILVTRSVAPAPSSPAPAPECSTSAFRSAATDTALLRPRTDLPSTRALPPAGSVLHRRENPAHCPGALSPAAPVKIASAAPSR